MRTKTIARCMILALVMVFMTAGAAFAGVGGSDVPTVPGSVAVNETGIPFSFTITNQSNGVNAPHTVEIIDGSIVFTTTCGSSLTPGIPCLPADQEAPNTISINPLTAVGTAGNCTGITFAVSPTANPNEYVFNASPLVPVLLGPADGSGAPNTCTISFDVDVNSLPTHDSSGDSGLQTSQLARVALPDNTGGLLDVTTNEHGSAAGSSTLNVVEPCLHVVKSCTDAATCVNDIQVSVEATNCGTEDLNTLAVSDNMAGTLTCGSTTLAPGASTTCTGSYGGVVGQDSTDTITATAVGALSGETVGADGTSVLEATCFTPECPASLAISKTCTDAATCVDSADFTVTVTNDCVSTATAPCQNVNNITVTDGNCTLSPDPSTPFDLAPGANKVFTCSISSPTPGVSADVSNTANASGTAAVTGDTVNATPDPTNSATCNIPGCPCQVQITKTVAPDDGSGTGNTACDGIADGPFVESVTVQPTDCVVYNICVTNSCTAGDCQTLDTSGVTVSDDHLGIVTENFGTLTPGQTTCKLVASEITVPVTACPNGVCVCQDVEGTNTAVVSSAICEVSQTNACDETGSVCSDTANVACLQEVGCRMTGGHNNDTVTVDAEYDGNGKSYTTGGQIGAPTNVGCCPEGPTNNGRGNKDCPWGEWEHNHHAGPDDSYVASGGTAGIADGSFAFHSGTASDPKESYIGDIICADPGWCVQARPAPVKQIYWEGIGVFHNTSVKKGADEPLPDFLACGANQPVPWSNKNDGTLHYYRAHVADFGEPAGVRQKDPSACTWSNTSAEGLCQGGTGLGGVSISGCELVDGYCPFDPLYTDQKFTDLHPLCTAQDCGCDTANDPACQTNKTGCPDWYEIEIHCTTDPNSPIAYKVAHFITEGNFQLHPAVGSTCNPSCGNGICEPYVPEATSSGEDCTNCPEDCGVCAD